MAMPTVGLVGVMPTDSLPSLRVTEEAPPGNAQGVAGALAGDVEGGQYIRDLDESMCADFIPTFMCADFIPNLLSAAVCEPGNKNLSVVSGCTYYYSAPPSPPIPASSGSDRTRSDSPISIHTQLPG